jgi:glycerol-3-phosphate acyltransferase PlsY
MTVFSVLLAEAGAKPSPMLLASLGQLLLPLTVGYLLGSIPFGVVLTRAAGLGDVRKIGSGNIGATNVLRTGNKSLAAATLLLDGLKATAAVVLVHWYLARRWNLPFDYVPGTEAYVGFAAASDPHRAFVLSAVAGFGAFLGHLYPVWLGFKGGKGVATYIGAVFGIFWPAGLMFCGLWLATALMTRISSLSALVACVAAPLYPLLLGEWMIGTLLFVMSVLVFHKHSENIQRIRSGEEPKIGAKA